MDQSINQKVKPWIFLLSVNSNKKMGHRLRDKSSISAVIEPMTFKYLVHEPSLLETELRGRTIIDHISLYPSSMLANVHFSVIVTLTDNQQWVNIEGSGGMKQGDRFNICDRACNILRESTTADNCKEPPFPDNQKKNSLRSSWDRGYSPSISPGSTGVYRKPV